jgi:hypothetical protein
MVSPFPVPFPVVSADDVRRFPAATHKFAAAFAYKPVDTSVVYPAFAVIILSQQLFVQLHTRKAGAGSLEKVDRA